MERAEENKVNSDILRLMANRSSCRSFSDKEIPDDIMDKLLKTAVLSPSSSGLQSYSIIRVTDRDRKECLAQYSMKQKFIAKAPVNLVFCMDLRREKRIINMYPSPSQEEFNFIRLPVLIIDASVAAQTLCIAAEAEGLRSIFIANMLNNIEKVSELLKLPKYVIPVVMVALGYSKSKGKISSKYGADIIVHKETYEDKDDDLLIEAFNRKYEQWNAKPNRKILDSIYKAALEYHGSDYAEACLNHIQKTDKVDPHQFYYGYWYRMSEDTLDLAKYKKFINKQGIYWL